MTGGDRARCVWIVKRRAARPLDREARGLPSARSVWLCQIRTRCAGTLLWREQPESLAEVFYEVARLGPWGDRTSLCMVGMQCYGPVEPASDGSGSWEYGNCAQWPMPGTG